MPRTSLAKQSFKKSRGVTGGTNASSNNDGMGFYLFFQIVPTI
jgi:hypothetical protein